MSIAPIFLGHITDGHLAWDAGVSDQLRQHLRSMDGKAVEAVIRPKRSKRSHDQNAYLWSVCIPALADALGYDRHEHQQLHYALLSECFGTTYDQRFGREIPRVGSSKMTTKEFSDYLDWLKRWAATEHGVVIPDPGTIRVTGIYLRGYIPKRGSIPMHVILAERALGKRLPSGAQVHHVDGNKHNNHPSNLVICQDQKYHRLLHVRQQTRKAGGNPNEEQLCSDCHRLKPFSEFHRTPHNKSIGRVKFCRSCWQIRWAARDQATRDRLRDRSRRDRLRSKGDQLEQGA